VSAVKARGAAAGPSAPKEEQGEIAGQGQQQMTQEELNYALYMACGSNNDQARAEELLGRGADPNALAYSWRNALHWAAYCGHEQIVTMLLSKGAVLEARTALLLGKQPCFSQHSMTSPRSACC
jgi:ankyrin repeat protein